MAKSANYKRELERYGAKTIEVAELFFFYDSCQILSIIKNSLNDEIRFLKLFKWLELIIVSFNLEKEIVLSFLNKHQEQFKIEFGVNKITRKQLSNKYRNQRISKDICLLYQFTTPFMIILQK